MERKEFELIMRKEISRKGRTEREASARAARTPSNLRSPISCIMVCLLFFMQCIFSLLIVTVNFLGNRVMSTRVRRSCWIKSVIRMCKRAKREALHSRLEPHSFLARP